MRFFRLHLPPVSNALLVESGSRQVLESALPGLMRLLGDGVSFDLVTCYAGLPEGLPESASVYTVHEYRARGGPGVLVRELAAHRPDVMAMICSGEPIMTLWKWGLALRLPVKVIVINENGDFFWLDRSNWSTIRRFALVRSGLAGGGAVRAIMSVVLFPFTLAFLLIYAACLHIRRRTIA
jgi:hypothetical protein